MSNRRNINSKRKIHSKRKISRRNNVNINIIKKEDPNNVDIYAISNEGSITNYAHFFFALLIPLIFYDSLPNNSNNIYNIKINIGNLAPILKELFPNRINTEHYIPIPQLEIASDGTTPYLSDRGLYYDTMIDVKYKKLFPSISNVQSTSIKEDILFPLDIFDLQYYIYANTPIIKNRYIYLETQYYTYYYNRKHRLSPLKQPEKADKAAFKQQTIALANRIFKNNRPTVNNYITRILENTEVLVSDIQTQLDAITSPIIIIERKFVGIQPNIQNNSSGGRRIIYNHDALLISLKTVFKDQVINVVLENLSIIQQIRIFRKAKVIIAQHGAGLSNMYFMDATITPNPTIIEMCPEWNIGNHWFNNLAKACNITYDSVLQPRMTSLEWSTFNSEHAPANMYLNPTFFNEPSLSEFVVTPSNAYKLKSIIDSKFNRSQIELFAINSGSVNIDDIINKVHTAINR